MLKMLDVLIGFSVVMLLASLALTTLTQAFIDLFRQRGRALKRGVATLLRQLDHGLAADTAGRIAAAVLQHPLVADGPGRPAAVIRREELIEVLLRLGASPGEGRLDPAGHAALAALLAANGIEDPSAALRRVHLAALALDASRPGPAELVARIHAWFDDAMERVSQQFTRHVRVVTAGLGLVLALAFQIDVVGLLNQLALQDAIRAELVRFAPAAQHDFETAPGTPDVVFARDRLLELQRVATSTLLPPPDRWLSEFRPAKIPGIALSALLLTLGAPFWFHLLKNALRLRPLLAASEDDQRRARRSAFLAAGPG